MIEASRDVIACPVCRQPLPLLPGDTDKRGALKRRCCNNNHSFDRAKQGYFNLLMAQQKKSRQPGDNLVMVQARQQFLDGGYYDSLSDALNEHLTAALIPRQQPLTVVDSGCGEGYYTNRLHQHWSSAGIEHSLYGVDISRDAIRLACQRSRDIEWLVASGANLPFLEGTLDAIISVFTPVMAERWSSLLQADGEVWLVVPAENHLLELRQQIYPEVRRDAYSPEAEMTGAGFQLQQHTRHSDEITVPATALPELLTMTPHGWRITDEKRQALLSQSGLKVTLDVSFYRFSASTADQVS